MNDGTLYPVLRSYLDSGDTFGAEQVAAQLALTTPGAVGFLLEALASEDRQRRYKVVCLLAHLQDDRIVPALAPRLLTEDFLISRQIAAALARQRSTQGYRALTGALLAAPAILSVQIIGLLAEARYQPAARVLMDLVRTTEAESIRYTAIEALGQMHAQEAADLIRQYVNDANHHVQRRAARALEQLNTAGPHTAV